MTIRHRLKTHTPLHVYQDIYADGIYALTRSLPHVAWQREEEMTDTVTPAAHSKLRSGEIINNPMTYSSLERYHSDWTANLTFVSKDVPPVTYTYLKGNQTEQFMRLAKPIETNPLDQLDSSVQETVAKQICIARVDPTPYEFFEDAAEIRETIQFLRNPTQALTRLIQTFVKHKKSLKKIPNYWERTQALASLWNQYRFAASPLLRSMTDAMDLLSQKQPHRPKRRRASGRAEQKVASELPFVETRQIQNQYQTFRYEKLGYRSHNYHATILYEVSNPLENVFWKIGLRRKDIPKTMWEILPYSFMFDRLLNIKAMITGLTNFADANVTFLAASVTKREVDQFTISCTEYSSLAYNQIVLTNPDFLQYDNFRITRDVWTPSLFDTVPSFTPGNLVKDITSILDLISILLSMLPTANPAWDT